MSAEPFVLWKSEQPAAATTGTDATVDDIDPDIAGAAYELAEFAGLTGEPVDPDFAVLPKAVQLAVLTVGTWASGGTIQADSTDAGSAAAWDSAIAKGPALTVKAKPEGGVTAVAKAEEPAAKALQPGEGRKMASDLIAEDVKRIRKEHPNWSEAKTWDWALTHDEHAIATYTRGELAERTTRKVHH